MSTTTRTPDASTLRWLTWGALAVAFTVRAMATAGTQLWLDELLDFACRPPRVHRHEWRAGDVVVWDNRCVLHRARPYDHSEPRVMVHVRVAGDPATEGG